jgi:hypothetical protein
MPGRRRSTGQRAPGSRLARLAGISVAVLIAAGAVAAYLVVMHPAKRQPRPLPARVVSVQQVGLIARVAQPGSSSGDLLQLLDSASGTPQFTPLGQAQQQAGSPQWTADLMAGDSYIFIYLPTGHCLASAGTADRPRLTLEHCDLMAQQRWRRTNAAVLFQGHDFYQYENLGDASCLTETNELPGPVYGAALQNCLAGSPASQLIGFFFASV